MYVVDGNTDRDRVRDAVDLVQLIGQHVRLTPKGREHVGLCPFHDDSRPSFAVVTHKGHAFYKCHACGAAGDAEVDRIHTMVDELGLRSQVRFVEPVPHHLLSTYYRAADLVVAPSRSESFGLVALEAAACGTPVLAAAVGGLRTLVAHGRTGFLVEGRDPAVYAAYANEILDSPLLAAEMAMNAAERARSYTWTAMADRLISVYSGLRQRVPVSCF